MERRARVALAFTLAASAAAGCAGLIGADFDAHPVAASFEAAPPDVAPPGETGPPACVHAEVPPNKARGQNLGGTQEAWVAIYTIDYGDGDGVTATYGSIGYDLDHVCTALGDTPVCVQGKRAPKDGTGGRDNASGELLFELKSTYPIIANSLGGKKDTQAIQAGAYSVILHVSGYNGQPDDDQVRFEWYLPASFGSDRPEGGVAPAPGWTGADRWPLRRDDFSRLPDGGVGALAVDDNAYVSGGMVVASLPKGSRIVGGAINFDLSGVFVTAQLTAASGGFAMTGGTIAGTWGQAQLLGGLGLLFETAGKCTDFPIYQQLKSVACSALDVAGGGVPLPTQPCDALSIGVAFTAKPVLPPTTVVDAPIRVGKCPPATDPANDACFLDAGAGGG